MHRYNVLMIDIRTRRKIGTIPTAREPLRLYFLQWRKEVWVHFADVHYSFTVIKTEDRNSSNVLSGRIQSVNLADEMIADQDMLEGKTAFVTTFSYPGIKELNLETKNYTNFRNFAGYGCAGTSGIAYNSYNKHLYVGCRKPYQRRSTLILELDTVTDTTKNWSLPGVPFVSPDGRFVVLLYRTETVTNKQFSRINILAVNGTRFNASYYADLHFPGWVSNPVFYPKGETSGSYFLFLALEYTNKMAVVDLELAKTGNISYVKYIEDVDSYKSGFSWESRSDWFVAEKWIISPITVNKTVVIINAETQKIHAKIRGVNGAHFAVWVPASTSSVTSGPTPSVTSGPAPSVTSGPTPSVTSGPAPSVTSGPTPSVTSGPAPSVTSGPTPSVTSGPAPSVTSGPTSSESPRPTTTGYSQNTTSGTFGIGRPSCLIFLMILYAFL
ncbi:follistatin-related protein 4-like isoform X2 [Dendronephthya gigantea]|nr:follistatin-related protein 4-like isoform X2 [Dendronephthya gigantea]XP_028391837.1 follistatin-related protein 4-like isoform X2 [Dendronephthya gigantea]